MSRFIYCYAERNFADCRYAECRHAKCRYAECHYTECHYAECRGAVLTTLSCLFNLQMGSEVFMPGRPFQPSLIFVSKIGAYPSAPSLPDKVGKCQEQTR